MSIRFDLRLLCESLAEQDTVNFIMGVENYE